MHKKLGPLEAWQWAAILAGLVLVYYEYEKSKANAASSTSSTGSSSTDTTGPIDPTTGIPYADEIGTGAGLGGYGSGYGGSTGGMTGDNGAGASTNSGTSLQQELSDLGAIESLMSGLGLGTGGSTTNTTVASGLSGGQTKTLNTDLRKLNSTIGKDQSAIGKLQKQVAKLTRPSTKPGGHKNPGHTVTTHSGGARVVSSSAPHSAQQHRNIAPPSHQRATHRPAKKRR